MAIVFAYNALNQYTEKDFFNTTVSQDVEGTPQAPVITAFTEPNGGSIIPKWEIFDINIPVSLFNQYAATNDAFGLQAYLLQGDDFIDASDENDVLAGFAGDDLIVANGGNDYINGNQGMDFINGNLGNDTVEGGKDDDLVEGGQGNDSVNGNMGNDFVQGNKGNDVARGGQGDDLVMGGQGNDSLYGDFGHDILLGDLGNDTLTGGEGIDMFGFTLGFGKDTITDFQDGVDVLAFEISSLGVTDFSQLMIGNAGGNAQVTVASGDSVVLLGISPAQLDANDVTFV